MYIGKSILPRLIDCDKFRTYLDLRSQKEKCLKSIATTRYCDWVIHKKLLEAGGLGDTVYIYPARGGGRLYPQLELYKKLMEEGRDVKVVKVHDRPLNVEKFKEVVLDRDLWCSNPMNERLAEQLGEYVRDFYRKRITHDLETRWHTCNPCEFKPRVDTDAYIYDYKYIYDNWSLVGPLLYGNFIQDKPDLTDILKGV